MDEDDEKVSPREEVPESPKPLAFTIDFGGGKSRDSQKHKSFLEKYEKRHRRGQSLSKLEDPQTTVSNKKHPLTGNLPRKSSFQSEGYFSSDERPERNKNVRASVKLVLPLRNVTTDKMTQSCTLPSVTSPEIELKDVSSPELDLVSPFSPHQEKLTPSPTVKGLKVVRQYSSPECESKKIADASSDYQLVDGTDFDFDKSDTVSDTGTYTLDADNYSEEQKARMSIDREFKIEEVSVLRKAEEYVRSLSNLNKVTLSDTIVIKAVEHGNPFVIQKPQTLDLISSTQKDPRRNFEQKARVLSPILSPTQNLSITQSPSFEQRAIVLSPILSPAQNLSITQSPSVKEELKQMNNGEEDVHNKTFSKILFPSPKARTGIGSEPTLDQGSVISVTSSGAFRSKSEKERRHARQLSLTKSEVHVEAYTDNGFQNEPILHAALTLNKANGANLTANVIHVAESSPKPKNTDARNRIEVFNTDSDLRAVHANITLSKITNLPPSMGGFSGKVSPTKIPSPIHSSRPRSRSSISSLNIDLSDSSLETESYLRPTQTIINTLQQRLSLDSDRNSEIDTKFLNNDARNLLKKPTHLRHNSFDDRNIKISNKLEHFQNKNLQGIDQTYTNMLNQYTHKVNKIQNSPNNSPIRRSSSFSTKNQINTKNSNLHHKDTNIVNSPSFNRNGSIQRSASTASIKPNFLQTRRSSVSSDYPKIDRNQFGDTESSSEDDYDKNLQKKKDITNTRYNRAFSLRRARLDEPVQPKCPNTPEMRRKFQPCDPRSERAISVDRKPAKTNEVQSRYLQNIAKKNLPPSKPENSKYTPRIRSAGSKPPSNKSQVFSRTDSGRFSMRTSTTKPPASSVSKNVRKDGGGKKQSGGRSNSSLSSREVDFQNWKRRKSYDPMKAAAEGKRKAELAKRQNSMTQSYTEANQDCDSSPSHSSSVHRSQSFHGTAALEQLISSDEDDLTLSADEGFSPPTPSPCELSPARASLKYAWRDQVMH